MTFSPVCVTAPVRYLFDGEVIDEVVVVFVQVAVQGHAVALVQQVLQGVDALDAQRALQAVLQVRVIEDDVEAESLGPHRYGLARTPWGQTDRPGSLTEDTSSTESQPV